jgi:hypothetical protein
VFNCAEWADEEAHRAAIARGPQEDVDSTPWQQVHTWPGLVRTAFDRFHPGVEIVGAARAR